MKTKTVFMNIRKELDELEAYFEEKEKMYDELMKDMKDWQNELIEREDLVRKGIVTENKKDNKTEAVKKSKPKTEAVNLSDLNDLLKIFGLFLEEV